MIGPMTTMRQIREQLWTLGLAESDTVADEMTDWPSAMTVAQVKRMTQLVMRAKRLTGEYDNTPLAPRRA